MSYIIGVPLNWRAPKPAEALIDAASVAGVTVRPIDLTTLVVERTTGAIRDAAGAIALTHLAPGLVYGEPGAIEALHVLEGRCAPVLNPQRYVNVADDKLTTAAALTAAAVPQPETVPVPAGHLGAAHAVGYPLILKRPQGALGVWVRRVTDRNGLAAAAAELLCEGGDLLLAQREVSESLGTAIRVIVLDGHVLAATARVAPFGEWRSNVAQGGRQYEVRLDADERAVALAAANAVGLGFAGVDLVRSKCGPLTIEVNAMPGFTSMRSYVTVDIAGSVIDAVLRRG